MNKAVRAIIIENNSILVMHRNKHGSEYFTLVGGKINENESAEEALVREIKEETGMDINSYQLVYIEEHSPPYNQQFVYLCSVSSHEEINLQDVSEEAFMNRIGINMHLPQWVDIKSFEKIPFRTPQLQTAIGVAFKKGFPHQPIVL
ncbi:MAG: hypothetical protein NVSMB46_00030 [Candidatus Saccharimonadales bacterium]